MKKLVNGELVDLTQEEIDARNAETQAVLQKTVNDHKKIYREKRILDGITINGITIEGDDKTQLRLAGARIEADNDANYTVDWSALNGKVTLNATQIIALSSALREHIQKCFDAYFIIKDETYDSVSDLENAFETAYNGA